MPLPTPGSPWPPPRWLPVYQRYALHAAWYSGDPQTLAEVYYKQLHLFTSFGLLGPRGAFWARDVREERRVTVHVPVAGDISAKSASMLFSESPTITIPTGVLKRDSDRLTCILECSNAFDTIQDAADVCSALGGVWLKVNVNENVADYPLLSIGQADNAIPEWQNGILTAVTFWKDLPEFKGSSSVYRWVERHEPGTVENALYRGGDDNLGRRVALTNHPDTAYLQGQDSIKTGIEEILAVYVPNVTPNRLWRGLGIGRSDYAGSEGLMDSLDEVYTNLIRDVRLGAGKIIAPESYFARDVVTGEYKFDLEKEVYIGVNTPSEGNLKDEITINQFAIRAQEHIETATTLMRQIFQAAGYSPESFGIDSGGKAETGTALNIRERASQATSNRKAGHWQRALRQLFRIILEVDSAMLGKSSRPFTPEVVVNVSAQNDPLQLAQSVQMLAAARAASTETLVRMLHQDWTEEQVQTEITAIKDEQGMSVPDAMQSGVA